MDDDRSSRSEAIRLVTNLIRAVHDRARDYPQAPPWEGEAPAGAPWTGAERDIDVQADHLIDLLPASPTDLLLEHLNIANVERCEQSYHALSDWELTDWATAAAGEMGEVCGVVKKIRRISSNSEDALDAFPDLLEPLGDEIANVVIYLDLLATRAGINLASAIRRKFNATSDKVGSTVRL